MLALSNQDTIAEALFPYILIELVCVDGARQRKLDLRSVVSKQAWLAAAHDAAPIRRHTWCKAAIPHTEPEQETRHAGEHAQHL